MKKKKQHMVPNNVLKVNLSEKKNSIWCQTYAKTEDHIELKLVFQFLASPAPILGTTENATFYAFYEEILAFEDWIFIRLSSLVLACEWTTNRNKFIV